MVVPGIDRGAATVVPDDEETVRRWHKVPPREVSAMTQDHRHHVVVIGSGFGGLFGTKALKRADVDVTVIAKTTHHLFQPLLYQVATGILSQGEIAPPT